MHFQQAEHISQSFREACNPHKFFHRRYCIKYFQDLFDLLSDKDKSLLGHYYGAFSYEKMKIEDIATLEMMTENGVKKAKEKAVDHFWELFPKSNFSTWIGVFHRVRMQIKYPDIEYLQDIYAKRQVHLY